jgi:hypothetical protein
MRAYQTHPPHAATLGTHPQTCLNMQLRITANSSKYYIAAKEEIFKAYLV